MTVALAIIVALAVAWAIGAAVYLANGHESTTAGLEWPWRGLAPPGARSAGRMAAALAPFAP